MHQRLIAFGNQLIQVHIRLREQLADLRQNRQTDLRAHCLSFCAALDRHHNGETSTAFPALEKEFPELAPVLATLREDHAIIDGILRRLATLADDPAAAKAELDGLAALMESHFTYEERKIAAALNELDVDQDTVNRALGVPSR